MPELPEVDAIAGVARKYSVGNVLSGVAVIRQNGKYFTGSHEGESPWNPAVVLDVSRVGKLVMIEFPYGFLAVHNAMTGYFDWEHEPWTFDYVEGKRKSSWDDVRVKFLFQDGRVLRFHDTRLFGSMKFVPKVPTTAPELMVTPNGRIGRPIVTEEQFYQGLQVETAIKPRLMDQSFIVGVGNIYANEACHAAGLDPTTHSNQLTSEEAGILLDALRWSVEHCIPQVRYDWLNVYRRTSCGSCGHSIVRAKLGGRTTFRCERCQT